ncbi:hypothetical protein ACHQM5_017037 [Ranunculus cassubicifolius]
MSSSDSSGSGVSSVSKSKNIFSPSKWFLNKSLKLSLPRSQPTPPPMSPRSPLPSSKPKYNKEDEMQRVFTHFDTDGDGKISSLELRSYFGSIGEYMSHDDAQQAINDLDVDGDGLLDFEEFKRFMTERNDDDLKRAFEMFEAEKGSGCITPKSLQRMLNRLGDSKSYQDCEAMIRFYDLDDNGTLDFHEFHCMMA